MWQWLISEVPISRWVVVLWVACMILAIVVLVIHMKEMTTIHAILDTWFEEEAKK